MDNRVISIRSEGREAFDMAVRLLFDNAPSGKASSFYKNKEKGLVIRWGTVQPDATALVCSMGWKEVADMAWTWMLSVPDEERGDRCDHDGSDGKGFHVYCEDWGHVGGDHFAFMAVRPIWAWCGK